MHHLVQAKGKRDPLFKTALMQSPAFQWQWERSRNGTLESCLRGASTTALSQAAQQQYNHSHSLGLLPSGPAIDDLWLSDLPSVAFAKGS